MDTKTNSPEEINKVDETPSAANTTKTNSEDLLFDNMLMQNLSYEQIKKLLGDSKSLLAKHLTEEVFNEYKDVKTSS